MKARRWKVFTPRPRLFATIEEATAHAEAYRVKTGVFVAVEEVCR